MRCSTLMHTAVALTTLCGGVGAGAKKVSMQKLREHQARAASKYIALPHAEPALGGPGPVKNITFTNPRASGAYTLSRGGVSYAG